jgi:ATP-dependent RNA helicase TDRD9
VALERRCEVGSLVGYQVGLHKKMDVSSHETRVLFCTTGVLLQKLISMKNMSTFTHVILDEVHERDADMDFLLIAVRKFLTTNSPNTKVILMSATIDSRIVSILLANNPQIMSRF